MKIESSKDFLFLNNCNTEEISILENIITFYKFSFSLENLKNTHIKCDSDLMHEKASNAREKLKKIDELHKFFNLISFQCDNIKQKIWSLLWVRLF